MIDSSIDTRKHIAIVQEYMAVAAENIASRSKVHDASKLQEPEKSKYDAFLTELGELPFKSPERAKVVEKHKDAIEGHYAVNSHHPEHYENGVSGMSLFDVIEMLIDWKAAGERDNGNIFESIDFLAKKYSISPQLSEIMVNTAKEMGW